MMWQCSSPVAVFEIQQETVSYAPTKMYFSNKSKNANAYSWYINGNQVSNEENLNHLFLESGRYQVELKATEGSKTISTTSEVIILPPQHCTVLLETTAGNLVVELLEETPAHLINFIELTEKGFYDGLIFHRVIDDFMIQGGDNSTRGSGKRYNEPETIAQEIQNEFPHYRGALAAARMPNDMNPEKASSGSQFYIVDGRELNETKLEKIESTKLFNYNEAQINKYLELGGAPQLDGEYTVFGYLVWGFDALDRIAESTTDAYDKPLQEVKIIKATALN